MGKDWQYCPQCVLILRNEIVVRMRIDLFQEDMQHSLVSSNLQKLHDHCTSVTLTPFYPIMHHARAGMFVGVRVIVFSLHSK